MSTPKWVRLHLAPQTEDSSMPPYVVGLMTGETAAAYVLNPMLEKVEEYDEEYGDIIATDTIAPIGMNFINKTYVWRCQILEEKPDIDSMTSEDSLDSEGGLG
jgi:hypothetical protein